MIDDILDEELALPEQKLTNLSFCDSDSFDLSEEDLVSSVGKEPSSGKMPKFHKMNTVDFKTSH